MQSRYCESRVGYYERGYNMPIRPENKSRYPKNWQDIRKEVRSRSGDVCEGSPMYPDCSAINGLPHPATGSKVVLTVAHLDHTPENCDMGNLMHWCQKCHNAYDAPVRAMNRKNRLLD
jgi:5-methylcytosine-specific restriction endonuclease McrA